MTKRLIEVVSALARLGQSLVADRLVPLLESGLVARCTPTDLEAGFFSTSPASHQSMRQQRSAWPFVQMTQQTLDRSVAVQDALAERSQQRGAKIADLLIAAVAEADRSDEVEVVAKIHRCSSAHPRVG